MIDDSICFLQDAVRTGKGVKHNPLALDDRGVSQVSKRLLWPFEDDPVDLIGVSAPTFRPQQVSASFGV